MTLRIISLLVLLTHSVFGNKYGNVWQFGDNAGIDFNSCEPVALTNGNNSGFEGCASYSDTAGQLLFYTNSDLVWNRSHVAMPNGNLVAASGSLSQVIIIPRPLSTSLYYIVTTKLQAAGTLSLQYHVVDISLNSGLGDVTIKNNVMTSANITEQIAATWHANGTDIWLMAHEYGTNNFLAYLVTSAGISQTPVISSIGPLHVACNSNINARGAIKFSPDGNKLAFNANGVGGNDPSNLLCIFDFDNSSGIVFNPINLPFSRGDFGLSFSANSSKLYGTTWKGLNFGANDNNYIYQFDLSSNNASTIIASKEIIDSIQVPGSFGDIKLAPNGKIYVAKSNAGYLGVITNPNQAGLSCNYISNGFFLAGKTCNYGLNNYIEYTNNCEQPTEVDGSLFQNSLKIFPNPSTGTINIILSSNTFIDKVKIYNITGQIVFSEEINLSTKKEIQVDNLKAGIYFVKMSDSMQQYTTKFIVE
ncbi:MAG: T9SS type A sorting domain-containing protein [Bacteroidia bacterium]|nr:T9SS type A sorting domain-containing protein [Bacteroidia bacterium]